MISYEKDLAAWMYEQIECLKKGQYDKIDMVNFLEEVEGVVRAEKRFMKSHFIILLAQMLKWEYQPSKRSRSWLASINNARYEINSVIEDSPSLKNYEQLAFEQAWEQGRKMALEETGLTGKYIPRFCPWSVDEVMDKKFSM